MTAHVPPRPDAGRPARGSHADYLCIRVLDALLREDVRECVSKGRFVRGDMLPADALADFGVDQHWLRIDHLGPGALWIAVTPARYMQDWRVAGLPVLRESTQAFVALRDIDSILAAFADGLPDETARLFSAYADECKVACEHRGAALAEQTRWFALPSSAHGHTLPTWHQRMLHYERLAAFLDHPYYPSARAKVGFAASDLARYAPEFQPVFELHWLAVPAERYHSSQGALPAQWPGFVDVGLPASLAATHRLVPVHPFVWRHHLSGFLDESALTGEVIRAPRTYLSVTPTLSVRSLALLSAPDWHVKLPLTIRTLGAKNIRTIKPSTIADGQRIQSLLQDIAASETALRGRVVFTDESSGAHVDKRPFLGFILRRYPADAIAGATLAPVAGLLAHTPRGKLAAEELAERFHASDLEAWFDVYLELTLRLHLTLWLRYGIALESNQQNTMLVYGDDGLRLLLKDNDAARIDRGRLAGRWPKLARHLDGLEDERIAVSDPLALAQMFTTITLQLNIAALVEGFGRHAIMDPAKGYERVRARIEDLLNELAAEGEDTTWAREVLLEDDRLYLKYLLTAASLFDKTQTGAADVNKFYGKRAPNFLKSGS